MNDIFDVINNQGYYIIAEIGVNYYDIAKKEKISVMDAAKLMCKEACNAGANAVKFQTYKAGTIASKYSPSYWDTKEEPTTSQYELFKKFDSFGEDEYRQLKQYCDEIGVEFLSTPFDFESADYLEDMMNVYKISSSDLTNIPFIEYMCKKGKPVILSVGASHEDEIDRAVSLIRSYGNKLVLMHCVLEYPTPYEHANLGRILALQKKYNDCVIGYSDHTKPEKTYDIQKTAFLLGAKVIEKHFTLDKTLKGNDHYHAMDVNDLKNIKASLEYIKKIIGAGTLACNESESAARANARRSVVLKTDMKNGDIIKENDITFKRPGIGIEPYNYKELIGRKLNKDLPEDSILKWEDID